MRVEHQRRQVIQQFNKGINITFPKFLEAEDSLTTSCVLSMVCLGGVLALEKTCFKKSRAASLPISKVGYITEVSVGTTTVA